MAKRKDGYSYDDKAPARRRFSWRNLTKEELGAVIFRCDNRTMAECFEKHLLGMPDEHISYVEKITPGLTLFLFNHSDRTLHGIFEAASFGEMFIDSKAFTANRDSDITPYAAQVRFKVYERYKPLSEEEFRPIIASNYFRGRIFWSELDKEQASNMTKLFLSSHLQNSLRFYCHPRTPDLVSSQQPNTHLLKYEAKRIGTTGKKDVAWKFKLCNQSKLKTEMCIRWQVTGACSFQEKCEFAHGINELRPLIRHPLYKTQVCRMVLAGHKCPYGQRCLFRHSLTN